MDEQIQEQAHEQPEQTVDAPIEVSWGKDPIFWIAPKLLISQIQSLAPLPPYDGECFSFVLRK